MSDLRATACDRQGCDVIEKGVTPSGWLTVSVGVFGEKLHFCSDCIPKVCDALAPLTGRERLGQVVGLRMLGKGTAS